jgi:hypothetical protein
VIRFGGPRPPTQADSVTPDVVFSPLRLFRHASRACLPLVLLSALWLAGCAAEGPPHPPRIQRPETVHDLAVRQVGKTLILTFHAPSHAADGRRLTKPIEVLFFREIPSSTKATPPVLVTAKPWLEIRADDLPKFELDGVIRYAAELSLDDYQRSAGKTFQFTVQCLTRGFRRRPFVSDPSNAVTLRLEDVSEPVEDLRADPSQHAINLRWSAPTHTLTGKPVQGITGYEVFRSTSGKPGTFAPIGTSPTTAYADKKFEFGKTYYYTVRARFGMAKPAAESADSTLAVITPRDIFPPSAPQGLTGIYTGKAVELVWTPNPEPGIAGYNVYRREDDQKPQKLNASPEPTAIYRDFAAQAGHRYLYWITAVDLSKNESGPSAPVWVDAQ